MVTTRKPTTAKMVKKPSSLLGSPKKKSVRKEVSEVSEVREIPEVPVTVSAAKPEVKKELSKKELKRAFYFLKEDVLEKIRKIAGEKNFLYFCYRLQTEFNFGASPEFWLTVESEKGKRKLVHFDRSEACREVFLSDHYYRYEEIVAAKEDGTLRSIGWINPIAA